jgi:hypothetical protein
MGLGYSNGMMPSGNQVGCLIDLSPPALPKLYTAHTLPKGVSNVGIRKGHKRKSGLRPALKHYEHRPQAKNS